MEVGATNYTHEDLHLYRRFKIRYPFILCGHWRLNGSAVYGVALMFGFITGIATKDPQNEWKFPNKI